MISKFSKSLAFLLRRLLAPAICLPLAASYAGSVNISDGQSLAFLGDSITQFGNDHPGGYVRLVVNGLAAAGIKVKPVPAGVSGNTSTDMLNRLNRDVLAKKPDWMLLSCGVNDVWHGAKGVVLDAYKKNITQIVDQAQAAGIHVMILTATMIGENPAAPMNQKLIPYNDFLRSLATEKHCLLADLNAEMQANLKELSEPGQTENLLTVDGVHMNGLGNEMMASGILKGFGISDEELAKDRETWKDIPSAQLIDVRMGLSVRQYIALKAEADKQKLSVDALLRQELQKKMDELAKPAP